MTDRRKRFQPGDLVVYTKPKSSTRPGPRAKHISPARRGDSYSYVVDKFWVIAAPESDDGTVLVMTRRGKSQRIQVADQNLQRASLWQRFVYRSRFPQLPIPNTVSQSREFATN